MIVQNSTTASCRQFRFLGETDYIFNRTIICVGIFFICSCNSLGQRQSHKVPRAKVDIHNVDFNNVNYRIGTGFEGLSKSDFKVLSVKFGDLTGDGNDEAAVHVSWSFARFGGSGYGYVVDLFTVKQNRLVRLTRLDGGSKSDDFKIVLLDIEDSKLVVRQCDLTRPNYDQFLTTVKYEWNGERLIEIDRKRTAAEDCWGV